VYRAAFARGLTYEKSGSVTGLNKDAKFDGPKARCSKRMFRRPTAGHTVSPRMRRVQKYRLFGRPRESTLSKTSKSFIAGEVVKVAGKTRQHEIAERGYQSGIEVEFDVLCSPGSPCAVMKPAGVGNRFRFAQRHVLHGTPQSPQSETVGSGISVKRRPPPRGKNETRAPTRGFARRRA